MKAILYRKYGPPDVLKLEELEKPVPADNEVLVKVHAASINSWDWDMVRGKPFLVRMWGLLKPKYKIPGADLAGKVDAVGKNVKRFKAGDEVWGDLGEYGWGAFAEYVCAPEKALALKPAGITFEQAAAVPQAGMLALQGLRDKRMIQAGQRVLINGAGGGVGSFAVQLAKLSGAEVTTVDSAGKLDMLRGIGADHVIDYKKEDFTKTGQRYDFILDVTAHRSIFDYKSALSSEGIYVMLGGTMTRIFQLVLLGPLISGTGSKKMRMLAYKSNRDLAFMGELLEAGKLTPVIDRCYPLHEVAEAFRHFASGEVIGKLVITM